MRFLCDQKVKSIDGIDFRTDYDCIFIGTEINLDDRSELVNGHITSSYAQQNIFKISYDSQSFKMIVNDVEHSLPEAFDYIRSISGNRVLIECTTIDFVELTLILQQVYDNVSSIDFLYLSPDAYGKGFSPSISAHDFRLSDSFSKSMPVPGFTHMLGSHGSKVTLVAFVGFEKSRIGRVLNDDENSTIKKFMIAFAIPPFQSGWENHSIFQHAQYLENNDCDEPEFISAYSPLSTYDFLSKRVEPTIEDNDVLQLAAYGTKPCSIGAAIYAVEKQQEQAGRIRSGDCSIGLRVSLQYDFPNKTTKRSSGIGCCYLYSLTV